MTENKKLVPKRRFKEFQNSGAWEQRKLGEITSYIKGFAFKSVDYNAHGIRIIRGSDLSKDCVSEYVDKIYIDKNKAKQYINYTIYNGDIVITTVGSKAELKESAVGRPIIFTENKGYLLNQNLVKIEPIQNYDSQFIYNQLLRERYTKYIVNIQRGNANQANITISELWEYSLQCPVFLEQKKIGTFFSHLDSLITFQQGKLEKTKALKEAYLSEMFPQKGESVPKRRFAGFTDAWERRKLGDCFDERQERSADGKLISVTINDGIRKFSELGRHDNSSKDKSHYKKVEIGDIAYNSMRMWQGASGFSPYSGILSPAYTVVVPKDDVDSLFFSYVFKRPQMIHTFQMCSQGITSDTWNLKYPAFSKIETTMPQIDEQKKIAAYFKHLDHLITLQQRKLEKLQNIKKAYLNEMFI